MQNKMNFDLDFTGQLVEITGGKYCVQNPEQVWGNKSP